MHLQEARSHSDYSKRGNDNGRGFAVLRLRQPKLVTSFSFYYLIRALASGLSIGAISSERLDDYQPALNDLVATDSVAV